MSTGYGLISDPAYQGDVPIPGERPEGLGEGTWPRMLELDEDTKRRLGLWLHEEIHRARSEKEPLIQDWIRWQKQYWAKPKSEVKNWPFPKAANIVVPLTAIAVEAVYARLINTLFSTEPFYSIRPKAKEWIELAPWVEKWFQTEIENPDSLDMYGFCVQAIMELCKLGTCIGKSGYEREVKKTVRTIEGVDESIWVETKNGASLHWVPLANFLIRLAESDPQTSPWVGEEHTFTWGELKRMVLSGRMDGDVLERIKANWTTTRGESAGESGEYTEAIDELVKTEPLWHEAFKVQEIWCMFDVDGDGVDEEIVVDFHWQTSEFLSARYNWYDDLHRPYRHANYFVVEGRIFGIGIGKQNEQFQEEVTAIHRQRLDNATLANMGMLALHKNSGYGPDEPIFPGKLWFFDDPSKDVSPFKLSEVYNSAYAGEEILVRYSEKRTGVNEVILGLPHEGTPGTATGDLTRLAEGNKRFDSVLKNFRRFLGRIGTDVLANYQQFGDQDRHWLILGEEGAYVEQVLRMPSMLVRRGAIVEVTASDSVTNREVEQQHMLGLTQIFERYFAGKLQLAQLVAQLGGDPQIVLQTALAAMLASDEVMKRLLSTFPNLLDAEKLLLGGGNGVGGRLALPRGAEPGAAGGLPQGAVPLGMGGVPPMSPAITEGEAGGGGRFP